MHSMCMLKIKQINGEREEGNRDGVRERQRERERIRRERGREIMHRKNGER